MRVPAVLVSLAVVAAACGAGETGSVETTATVVDTPPTTSQQATPTTGDVPVAAMAIPPSDGVERSLTDPNAEVGALVGGWNDAGFDLWRRLPVEENVVFSPASVSQALLMAAAAGDDTTRSAIEAAFALPDDAHQAWNRLDHLIADSQSDQVTVTIANRIWPRIGIEPDRQWIDLLAAEHDADVVPLDFANASASRATINEWVGDRTEGLIPDLIPEGFIDPVTTVLVLTNAIYFAADWETPFGKSGPLDGTFTTLDGTELDVSFMVDRELDDRRGVGEGFVGAEIPYAGDDYSMLVLVPDPGRYEELVDRLDQDLLDEIDATFTPGPYELRLPKWDDEYRIDLLDWLREIGAAPGSYPKITPEAFLSNAVHAADIAVDERGTVAAAATALGFDESAPPDPEFTIAADRPFVYLIRHRDSGVVLFAGHVTDPT